MCRIVQPFSCAVGLIIFCLKSYLCPEFICDYPQYLEKIQNNPPKSNYLSWACFTAFNDKIFIEYTKKKKPGLFFCEECFL